MRSASSRWIGSLTEQATELAVSHGLRSLDALHLAAASWRTPAIHARDLGSAPVEGG